MANERKEAKLELISRAGDLLNSLANNSELEIPYDSPAVAGFLEAAMELIQLEEKWSAETGFDFLFHQLREYQNQIASTGLPIPEKLVEEFVDYYLEAMSRNIKDHWVVIPLYKARLEKKVEFGDFVFLPKDMPREEKIITLANLSSVSNAEMARRAQHTETSRSPDFFKYTLLCHKINHHAAWAHVMAPRIALFDIAILRILSKSIEPINDEALSLGSMSTFALKPNKHVMISAEGSHAWGHSPIWVDDYNMIVNEKLAWLDDPNLQSRYAKLVELLGYMQRLDHLAFRFRKAAILYNKAINLQLRAIRTHEGFSLEVLHLMIAAENFLLDREGEKRLRLAVLLSRLITVENTNTSDIYAAIEQLYKWRSDYVHRGNEVFPEYDSDFKEGEVQKKIKLVRHLISRLIVGAPKWIEIAEKGLSPGVDKSSVRARETSWFSYIDDKWNSVLAGNTK